MNYEVLLNDEFIRNCFEKIEDKNSESISHGIKHALNVVDNIEKICQLLNIDRETVEYLKIAGCLHDIGHVNQNQEHYLSSEKIVRKFLENKIDDVWYPKILSAILHHHEKENVQNLSLFDHIVLFSDKMDFSYKRLNQKYLKIHPEESPFEKYILNIDFKILENTFIVIIRLENAKYLKDFRMWDFYPKIEKRIEEFASKLNMNYQIEFVF